MNKKIAIVVCGIKNHIILLNKLKARGFYTILVDGAAKPLAYDAADEFVQIDIFDFEGIKKLAIERGASLIMNACQEHLNSGICKIAEELNLTHPYSYETALDISNKVLMKKRMHEYGIPTTRHIVVRQESDLDGFDLEFPVYVKSCKGQGSNAVNRAHNIEDVRNGVVKALEKYPNSDVIVEEEALGCEYNAYCFPENGRANVLLIARRYTDNNSEDHITKLVGIVSPPPLSDVAKENIYKTAQKITDAFGLNNVPMFMQVMINEDKINVIEFAGRMGGGFGYQLIQDMTGVDLFEATINSFMNIPNNLEEKECNTVGSVSIMYAHPCTYGELLGYEELIKDGTMNHILMPKGRGDQITPKSSAMSLVAYMIHTDKTLDGLLGKINKTFDTMEFLDVDGNSQLNRELKLTKERILS